MVLLESMVLFTILGFLLYKWSTLKYGTFKARGIPHDKPMPLIGNTELSVLLGRTSFMKSSIEAHLKYKNSKVYGIFMMRDPLFIIQDVELIKKIGIRDFDYFPNHKMMLTSENGHILQKSLVSLHDRKWKEMRNTLTPAFTGSKMRLMFELINDCSIEGVKYLKHKTQTGGQEAIEVEMKEYFTRYANDVIATAAFGIKVNSFKEKDNEFYTIGATITKFSGWTMFKALLFHLLPKIMNALPVKVMNERLIKYFEHLVLDAMEYRELHHIIRPDMINLLMEAKKNFEDSSSPQTAAEQSEHAEFNDRDLVAQCLLFFFAGFETVSTCLCFTAHELLENPEVQQRLYEEILELESTLDGKPLNYDALMKMPYMDMVLSESLRKWPPAPATDRVCVKDYTLTDDDGNFVADFKKGDNLFIPILGTHYDPDNFEEPTKFNPERFSEENKDRIKPFTYLPFGVGPRNCIGNRFALMETKAIIYHLLLNFKILRATKTTKDMMSSIRGFQMQPLELFWMKFEPRDKA